MERTFIVGLESEYIELDYEDETAETEDELYESAVDYILSRITIEMY